MITEDYVSFETAKLLKEKGFDVETYTYWDLTTITKTPKIVIEPTSRNWNYKWKPFSLPMSAPTLQMAMKWLREVHNIFIQVELYSKYNDYCFELFQNTHRLIIEKYEVYNIYEEACEAGIKYCLKNLI